VTKKEIAPQLKESTGTSQARPKNPSAGGQRLPLSGRHGAEQSICWFLRFGGAFGGKVRCLVRTPVEGKIGKCAAAWPPVIQGHSKIGGAGSASRAVTLGLDMDCGASVQPWGVGRGRLQ